MRTGKSSRSPRGHQAREGSAPSARNTAVTPSACRSGSSSKPASPATQRTPVESPVPPRRGYPETPKNRRSAAQTPKSSVPATTPRRGVSTSRENSGDRGGSRARVQGSSAARPPPGPRAAAAGALEPCAGGRAPAPNGTRSRKPPNSRKTAKAAAQQSQARSQSLPRYLQDTAGQRERKAAVTAAVTPKTPKAAPKTPTAKAAASVPDENHRMGVQPRKVAQSDSTATNA